MSSITIMTTQGRAQLAAAVANAQSFPSAKIAVGDGNGATYVPNEAQVGLVHEVWRGNATVARTDDRVIFQAVVPAEIGGFTVREVGVLIGEIGAEQLFIISQHPSTEKIAAPANGSGPLPVTLAFSASAAEQAVLPIGSSDNATLQLSRAPHITVDGLVTEPPAEPADGSLYAIDAGAAGLFVGKGGWLVERVAGAWIYKQPPEKSVIRLAASGAWYQRDGADWAVLTFEDTSLLWAQIQDPPATFPPSVHNHDDRYFTEAEADGRFVKKAGDTMTGSLVVEGELVARRATGQPAVVVDAQASGGERPVVYLRKQGVDRLVISADGSSPGQVYYEARGANGTHAFFTNNAQRFAVQPDGALWVPNGTGSGAHILAGGVTPSWKTLAELGVTAIQTLRTESSFYGDINALMTRTPASPATEGIGIMSLAVTPKRADSWLRVRFTIMVGHAGGAYPTARVLHGATNVLTYCHTIEYSPWMAILTGEVDVPSGSTTERIISVRLGNLDGAANLKLNGSSTGGLTGSKTVMNITEVI